MLCCKVEGPNRCVQPVAVQQSGVVMVSETCLVVSLQHSLITLQLPSPPQVKTEEQIAAERAWYGAEKVWLVHKDGFSLGQSHTKHMMYT